MRPERPGAAVQDGPSGRIFLLLQQPVHVPDRPRRAGRAVGLVDERLDRGDAGVAVALERLQNVALQGENIFEELMNTVRVCSLGQITQALYGVGGKYRRNM